MSFLHSIYLTGDKSPAKLPWAIQRNIESFTHHHPDFTHKMWDDASGREFISEHFDSGVLLAWDELVPLSYRSDLLRYCLLFHFGGIYADVSVTFFNPLVEDTDLDKVIVFRELFNQAPWIVSTSLIHAPAGSELFSNCIQRVVANVRDGFYGTNPLCPTGPNLLGQEIARWGRLDAMKMGETLPIAGSHGGEISGRHLMGPEGDLMAVIAKHGAGLTSLGAANQDDYNSSYRRGKIYRSQLSGPDIWSRADYLKNQMTNAQFDTDLGTLQCDAGCALYGPYIGLEAGRYRARFVFGDQPPKSAVIDVVAKQAQLCKATRVNAVTGALMLEFSIDDYVDNVEIRLFLDEAQSMDFAQMELTRLSDG